MLTLFTVDGSVSKYVPHCLNIRVPIYTISRRQENLSCLTVAGVLHTWVQSPAPHAASAPQSRSHLQNTLAGRQWFKPHIRNYVFHWKFVLKWTRLATEISCNCISYCMFLPPKISNVVNLPFSTLCGFLSAIFISNVICKKKKNLGKRICTSM